MKLFFLLGFLHEHSRADRSKYIAVDLDAIYQYESANFWPRGTYARQYQMCSKFGCKATSYFDMQSIMMYGPYLQGTNVTVIKPKTFCDGKACEIGQRRGLSFLDIEDIASAYNCSKNYIFGNDRTKSMIKQL